MSAKLAWVMMRQPIRQWRCGGLIGAAVVITVACFSPAQNQAKVKWSRSQEQPFYVLFDNTKAETAGNADWVVDATGRDPHRITPIVPLPPDPQVENDWDGALSAWGVELTRSGVARVNSLPANGRITFLDPTNTQDLAKYHVFVVCEPNVDFTQAEREAIIGFIQRGGGLFIIGNHHGSDRNNDGIDAPRIWDNLFRESGEPRGRFGVWFNLVRIGHEDPDVTGDATDPDVASILDGPFGQVTGSIIRSGADMVIDTDVNPTVRGVLFRHGFSRQGRSGVFAALSRFEKGHVFAIGDSSPPDDGSGDLSDRLFDGWRDPAGTDRELFLNATVWLAASATVSDEPTIIGITPATVRAGRTVTVLINARHSHFAPGSTTVSFGDGLSLHGLTVLDSEALTVDITVEPTASGPRTVVVVTGGEVLQALDGFVITDQ